MYLRCTSSVPFQLSRLGSGIGIGSRVLFWNAVQERQLACLDEEPEVGRELPEGFALRHEAKGLLSVEHDQVDRFPETGPVLRIVAQNEAREFGPHVTTDEDHLPIGINYWLRKFHNT
jgi:hypothetical protein